MTNFEDVRAFHLKMELPAPEFPAPLSKADMQHRLDFILEEVLETQRAAATLEIPGLPDDMRRQAMAHVFDGLLDAVYVVMGTAVMMGLPWDEGWARVQAANMQKLRDPALDTEHHKGVVKPEGWVPPDLTDLVGNP